MTTIRIEPADRKALLDRFLRYVVVDTRSDENSTASPSTAGQLDLARLLARELEEVGCADVEMTEWGYVFATVPANLPEGHPARDRVPVIGLLAHVDTYFGTPGAGVKPQVIERYDGSDITLPGDPTRVVRVADNPNLARCAGHTVITSDGTTLLGADDKAGIAEILTVVDWLRRHPDFPHGAIRVGFTTDEEVSRGTEHFDVKSFGAQVAYTLDGADLGEIEDETFCADAATVTLTGRDVHPGYAKGKMVNAVRAAARLVEVLPRDFLPETTEGREPYLHPYRVEGDVSKVTVKFLVRAFTAEELREREDSLREAVRAVEAEFPGVSAAIEVQESYRNMREKLEEEPRVLEYAFEAVRRTGLTPQRKAIRGGTDGARLSFMGLPTPNLFAGGQNFHSVQEWVSLEWMAAAVECVLNLLAVWVERSAEP